MAEITQKPVVSVEATFKFNESELRALDALTGYGTDAFIDFFYRNMGKTYMQPHEDGLRSLFRSIKDEVPGILKRADDARKVFTGERIAITPPTGKGKDAPGTCVNGDNCGCDWRQGAPTGCIAWRAP